MRIGAVFPQTESGTDPGALRALLEGVWELGCTHLHAYDHVLGADRSRHTHLTGPYGAEHQFHEILVFFGYAAAVVPGLELVTDIVIAPQRQTALLAKQAAEIDLLTRGRFRLGLGIGWNDVEYEALGMDFSNRGRRFEEQIELLRRLWTEPVLDFRGRWHTVTAAGINPLPVQRPIPIWIGGSAEPALRRAARLGDGYFPQRPLEGGWPATIERVRGWVREAGRDPDRFGIDARIPVSQGTPEEWRAEAERWRSLGATHLSLVTAGGGLEGPDAHLERLRLALDAVR
ncbi:MAG TPA: LLM class F420-dependent oxidoreductase [Gaiellaceae bacterium]|nr:LLM class F420-dependent oxidoreductase [Gaiellaceae bacterium]